MTSPRLEHRRRTTGDDANGIRITQLLLGGLLLVAGVLVMLAGHATNVDVLVAGMIIAFLATGAAVALPWHRFPLWVSAVLPTLDIIAITLLREGSPASGFTILFVFPAMWAAWVWRLPGVIGSTLVISSLYGTATVLSSARGITPAVGVLSVAVAAAGIIAYIYASRTDAQRMLLERQSAALRRAVERATREEALLAEVLDAVEFGVAKLDADGEVVLANAASTAFMRVRKDAGTAVYAADGLTRIDPELAPNRRARRGELFEHELAWFGEAGDARRALRTSARPLTSGEEGEHLIITTDVTAEELALRARNDLVSSVSHEIRTPLTSILGYLELAIDHPELPASIRPNLEVAERNANRLLELAADILSSPAYTRTGVEIRIEPEQFDLATIVAGCGAELRHRADEAEITLDHSGVESAEVFGDPRRLTQVIENLVANAIKYNVAGGRVDLGLTSDGNHTWFIVRDSGAGISETEVSQIFERFFRAEAMRNTSTHGHGLGLAITRDIVRAHGGEVTVQSEVGVGSTFVVRLPARDPRAG